MLLFEAELWTASESSEVSASSTTISTSPGVINGPLLLSAVTVNDNDCCISIPLSCKSAWWFFHQTTGLSCFLYFSNLSTGFCSTRAYGLSEVTDGWYIQRDLWIWELWWEFQYSSNKTWTQIVEVAINNTDEERCWQYKLWAGMKIIILVTLINTLTRWTSQQISHWMEEAAGWDGEKASKELWSPETKELWRTIANLW